MLQGLFLILCFLLLSLNPPFLSTLDDKVPFYSGEFHSELNLKQAGADELFLARDSADMPLFYYSDIFTPVCVDNVCKPVRLRLFWDVCGNFLAFKIPSEEPMTKRNHIKFNSYDYYTLFVILNNPKAPLADFGKNDLVNYNNADDLDAVSGATSSAADHLVVPGAAYSTYTLWHLVYEVHDSIQAEVRLPSRGKDYWSRAFSKMDGYSTGELTNLLFEAERAKVLNKYPFQKLLVSQLSHVPPIQALLINNYLRRQRSLAPETERELLACHAIQDALKQMLP